MSIAYFVWDSYVLGRVPQILVGSPAWASNLLSDIDVCTPVPSSPQRGDATPVCF